MEIIILSFMSAFLIFFGFVIGYSCAVIKEEPMTFNPPSVIITTHHIPRPIPRIVNQRLYEIDTGKIFESDGIEWKEVEF